MAVPENWKQMRSGRVFPLPGFTAADIDLHGDVAESLARICRYTGAVEGNSYSVAQHCVIGADAAMEETGDANLAGYVLLHDAHDAVIGDIATPVEKWLTTLGCALYGSGFSASAVIAAGKAQLDESIWKAAGVAPPGMTYRRQIADYDLRLLATEKRQLLAPSRLTWGAAIDAARPIRLRGRLSAWPIARAADEYRHRLDLYCPDARRM